MNNISNYNKFDQKSINEVLRKINDNNKIMLPDIQRKFVWSEEKMLKFIDSILIGYPIGMFLFWELDGKFLIENKATYTFYKFINKFNERQLNKNDKIESYKARREILRKKLYDIFGLEYDDKKEIDITYIY